MSLVSRLSAAVVGAALLAFCVRSAVSGGAVAPQIVLCLAGVALVCWLLSSPFVAQPRDRIALAVLAGFVAVVRLQGLHEPLEADITGYAVTAHALVSGARFLVDIWGMRPPITYATFAAFEAVFGFGDHAVYCLNVSFTVITLYAVYHAARSFDRVSGAGLAAASLWVLLSGNVYFQGNQPNCEVMINALLTCALAVLLLRGTFATPRALWTAGLLLALASQYKQIVIVPALAFAAVEAGARLIRGDRRGALLACTCLLAPIALLWMSAVGYFVLTGRGQVFMQTYFQNTVAYVETNRAARGTLSLMVRYLGDRTIFVHAAYLAVLMGAAVAVVADRRKLHWSLFLAAVISAEAAIMLPGRYHPHYFQLWLPLIAIGCAGLIFSVPSRAARAPAFLVCFLMAACSVYPQSAFSPTKISTLKYGDRFVDNKRIGLWLAGLVERGERIFVWANATGLYYYSGRLPGAAVLWVNNLNLGPMRGGLEQTVFRQLADRRTQVIVFDRTTPGKFLVHLRRDGWVTVATVETRGMTADVLTRNDSALMRRLKEEGANLPLKFQ